MVMILTAAALPNNSPRTHTVFIYPYRRPGVYFLYMIFDPAFKRVQRLFRPRRLFPIVQATWKWQVLFTVTVTVY